MRTLTRGTVAAAALFLAVWAQANSYTIVDLGLDNIPAQIDHRNRVAGYSSATGVDQAVVYRPNGWQALRSRRPSRATSINARGDVAGVIADSPVMWKRGGERIFVAMPIDAISGALSGVTQNGTVVGNYVTSRSEYRCFRTDPDGASVDLGLMAKGNFCQANGVDDQGLRIVGVANVYPRGPGKVRAFLWENGKFRNLGVLSSGDFSQANAINYFGHVVGASSLGNGDVHAFLWSDGAMKDIGNSSEFPSSAALSISKAGEIVGTGYSMRKGRGEATRFQDGNVIGLEEEVQGLSDWELQQAVSVNNEGVIVGSGLRTDGWHGFMLLPQVDP